MLFTIATVLGTLGPPHELYSVCSCEIHQHVARAIFHPWLLCAVRSMRVSPAKPNTTTMKICADVSFSAMCLATT